MHVTVTDGISDAVVGAQRLLNGPRHHIDSWRVSGLWHAFDETKLRNKKQSSLHHGHADMRIVDGAFDQCRMASCLPSYPLVISYLLVLCWTTEMLESRSLQAEGSRTSWILCIAWRYSPCWSRHSVILRDMIIWDRLVRWAIRGQASKDAVSWVTLTSCHEKHQILFYSQVSSGRSKIPLPE